MSDIMDLIRTFGPFVLGAWALTIACTLIWPQRYFNSFLLMVSLLLTMLFVSGFFGENGGIFLLVCFLIVMLALFLVPVLLIVNGIQLIRRESLCLAHVLSLALGIIVGVGAVIAVVGIIIGVGVVTVVV